MIISNMKRERLLIQAMMLVTMLVSTMVFSACGDDDDKEKSMVGQINTMLTGGWRGQPVTGSGMIICKFGNDGSIGVAVSV